MDVIRKLVIDDMGYVDKRLLYVDLGFKATEINSNARLLMEVLVDVRNFYLQEREEYWVDKYNETFYWLWTGLNAIIKISDHILLIYSEPTDWRNPEREAKIHTIFEKIHQCMPDMRLIELLPPDDFYLKSEWNQDEVLNCFHNLVKLDKSVTNILNDLAPFRK